MEVERRCMVASAVCVLLFLASVATAQQQKRSSLVKPDRYCLSCLCVASSDCDLTTGCRRVAAQAFCGPFFMTEHLWNDSNVTALTRFGRLGYRECSQHTECAGEAITRYLSKHVTDCDTDGRITCKDFGLIHLLGYRECHDPVLRRNAESTRFVRRFVKCLVDTLALLEAGENVRPTCLPKTLSSLWQ